MLEVVDMPTDTALDRVVEAAKRMEEHEEVDRWEFSEDVLKSVNEEWPRVETVSTLPRGNRHKDSGFNRAVDKVNKRLYDEGVISVSRYTIVGAYKTAKAWPVEERVEAATYWAHYELRSEEFDGSRARHLRRLVAQNSRGRVGPKEVRLWKSGRRTVPLTSFLEAIEKATRSTLLRKGAPWDSLADSDRDAIVKMLRQIANEVASGEFGIDR